MLLGPKQILACPICEGPSEKRSYSSMNTFGAIIWSDNIAQSSMCANIKEIVLCSHCNQCSSLKDFAFIDQIHNGFSSMFDERMDGTKIEYEDPKILEEQYKNVPSLHRPDLNDLKEALQTNKNDEKGIRMQIWQTYNNSFRKEPIELLTEAEKAVYTENSLRLIELLDANDEAQLVIIAELYRNIGDFKKCQSALDRLVDEDLRIRGLKMKWQMKDAKRSTFKLYK